MLGAGIGDSNCSADSRIGKYTLIDMEEMFHER